MRPGLVVEHQIALHALMGRTDGLVRVQIDLLVFNALPQSLDEHVVSPAPFPIHADLDAVVGEQPGELLARELAPLVSVEDGWDAISGDGVLHRARQKSVVSVLASRQASTADLPSREPRTDIRNPGAWECR